MIKVRKIVVAVSLLLLAACEAQPADSSSARQMQAGSSSNLKMAGWVTDDADIIDHDSRERIMGKLRQLEQVTKHQLAVVTVPSLGGKDIASFTTALANQWEVGRKEINDGVVLLVAPKERKVRIAVGRGLETQLTDERCRGIIEQRIVPRFRAGDMPGGIEAGVDALIQALKGPQASSSL